jgi:hypothetical protein
VLEIVSNGAVIPGGKADGAAEAAAEVAADARMKILFDYWV